jgi:hypothetical protein
MAKHKYTGVLTMLYSNNCYGAMTLSSNIQASGFHEKLLAFQPLNNGALQEIPITPFRSNDTSEFVTSSVFFTANIKYQVVRPLNYGGSFLSKIYLLIKLY